MPDTNYPREIVVKFRQKPGLDLPHIDHLENHLAGKQICDWSQVATLAKDATLNRLFNQAECCDKLCSRAKHLKPHSKKKSVDFTKYFVLQNIPHNADLSAIKAKILSWKQVESVEILPKVGYPQTFLQPASDGVGAVTVRPVNGGAGEMIQIADIEGAWAFNHPAFSQLRVFNGNNTPWVIDSRAVEHGTNVLGVLCGNDAANQFTGVAPKVHAVFLMSHGNSAAGVIRAIQDAAGHLLSAPPYTGIILLEVEFSPGGRGPFPAEVGSAAIFEGIRAATEAGITVVEAAGNGNSDLRAVVGNRDSGAIMVAAGVGAQATGWSWWPGSNFGRRIDCFAAGQNVHTATTQGMGYAFQFGGTSSAAAIIAGVAAVTQSMALHAKGAALPPRDLRRLLRDPKFGTASASNIAGAAGRWIGNMPDLALIAQHMNAGFV